MQDVLNANIARNCAQTISQPTSPPRGLRFNQDSKMENTHINTKEKYQISTRNHQRTSTIKTRFQIKIDNEATMNHDNSITKLSNNSISEDLEKNVLTENCSQLEEQIKSVYTCKICLKTFNSSSNLDRHASMHNSNEQRPFRCKICAVSFTTSGNMQRHMKIHGDSKLPGESYESDGSTDSTNSNHGEHALSLPRKSLRKRRVEYNNNDSPSNDIKRKSEYTGTSDDRDSLSSPDSNQNSRRRLKTLNNNINDVLSQKYHCPVCEREDFASLNVFETHLEDTHPEYQIKCQSCNLSFKNHRVLNLHRYMVHHNTDTNRKQDSIVGFKDLTFIDFSSKKFPHIAKTVCEQSLHRADDNDIKFQCMKCSREFPCDSALEIHQQNCLNDDIYSNDDEKHRHRKNTEEDLKRESFFAGLDLKNKSLDEDMTEEDTTKNDNETKNDIPKIPKKEYLLVKPELGTIPNFIDTTKDLADIQSIISVASTGSLLQQLTSQKPLNLTHEQIQINAQTELQQITPPENIMRPTNEHQNEEETQDQFAAEFRKMKLRGEFPCRLCTAVFPNLRALKGHNRAHLTGSGSNGPYRCNMCPHSSVDKAALIRHMRTHNGDRPYECSLCNYAFTTKANCERHLRNRHAKVTRDEVKRAIIYHPSEDPTNDEMAGKMYHKSHDNAKSYTGRDEVKRSLIFSSPQEDHRKEPEIPITPNIADIKKIIPSIPSLNIPITNKDINFNISGTLAPSSIQNILNLNTSKDPAHMLNLTTLTKENLAALKEQQPKNSEILNLSSSAEENDSQNIFPKINVKKFQPLKQIPDYESSTESHSDSEIDEKHKNQVILNTPLSHFYNRDTPRNMDPIDLSMDVLDLSKKKSPEISSQDETSTAIANKKEIECEDMDQPHDFTKKTLESSQNLNTTATPPNSLLEQQFLLAQLFKGSQNILNAGIPPNFYATQLQNLYRSNANLVNPQFLNIYGSQFGSYFPPVHPFLTPTASPQELQERIHKEIIRSLQLSGGGLIMDHVGTDRSQNFQGIPSIPTPVSEQKTDSNYITKSEEIKPLTIETNQAFLDCNKSLSPIKSQSLKTPESIINTTPNSVKMVIKNGVLMPKQKQRRYRTERPFACEHCSARFTLRSNMERHIKQQHPQYWSQRQRSNMPGVPGRKPASASINSEVQQPKMNFYNQPLMQNYDLSKSFIPNLDTIPNNRDNTFSNNQTQPLSISEHVKYAILSQQLKQVQQNSVVDSPVLINKENNEDNSIEDEDNDALVIDEESQSQSQESSKIDGFDNNKKLLEEKIIKLKLLREKQLLEQEKEKDTTENISDSFSNDNNVLRNRLLESDNPDKNINMTKNNEEGQDLVSVSKLLDNASSRLPFREYFKREGDEHETPSEEEEEGLVASGSTSEGNISGSDGNRSESETIHSEKSKSSSSGETGNVKKKSAYSLAPNRVVCPYCHRKFPWTSSLRRHVLTHTGQKPYKCSHCPLLFTTKSNCDRHLLRKHGNLVNKQSNNISQQNNSVQQSNAIQKTDNTGVNAQNFVMRNVPERPYKCANCPSSTFSTLSNLKKHISSKHSILDSSNPNSPKSCEEQSRPPSQLGGNSGYESHSSEDEHPNKDVKSHYNKQNDWEHQISLTQSLNQDHVNIQQNSDLPFKCHLCDGSYSERQEALDHIRNQHKSEYDLLMSKNALETHATDPVDLSNQNLDNSDQDEQSTLRGKFPDYANRKVMCAFCMRRFWSAEDLRRHMRTHTGERPFSCDVCRRRFTLKHSMLRHRKKHSLTEVSPSVSEDNGGTHSGDDNDTIKSLQVSNSIPAEIKDKEELENTEGTDLIGNLLGIRDKSIIDQVLLSSADDAAKLLGVKKSE